MTVAEFSDSRYGQLLVDAVARDKFLRPTPTDPATAITRALEEITDLYYLDKRVIAPAIQAGAVVLKDRHQDTAICALVPLLVAAHVVADDETAYAWLRGCLGLLRHRPVNSRPVG